MPRPNRAILGACLAFTIACPSPGQDPLDLLIALEEVDQPTEVMVLATPHLSALGKKFKPAALDTLIALLKRWQPDAICVESLPASQVALMETEGGPFADVVKRFAGTRVRLGKSAQSFLDLDRVEANSELQTRLAEVTNGLDAEARAELIALALAAYEYDTAGLHWSYLDSAEREEALLPQDIIKALDLRLVGANETVAIATRLAAELGRKRIWATDDHWDKGAWARFGDTFGTELEQSEAYAELKKETFYDDSDTDMRAQLAAGDLLPYYLRINSPAYCAKDVELQWGMFLRTDLPSKLDRARLHLWQARNLRMTSHITEVASHHPGGKILVVVGAAHKPFLDTMLARSLGELEIHQLSKLR